MGSGIVVSCFFRLVIEAVMSLSACIYFSVKHHEYSTEKDIVTVGSSVGCAGVGGGFQIVLVNSFSCFDVFLIFLPSPVSYIPFSFYSRSLAL